MYVTPEMEEMGMKIVTAPMCVSITNGGSDPIINTDDILKVLFFNNKKGLD